MRLIFRSLALTSLCALAALAYAPRQSYAAEPYGADALWVWSWSSPESLGAYASEQGFNRVYLYTEGGFTRKVKDTISDLKARGLAVEALGGEPQWATRWRDGLREFVRSARSYQRNAPAGARLDGIHIDVEPYALHAWDAHPKRTQRGFLRSLRVAHKAAGPLPLAADIPFWYDGIRLNGESYARRVIRTADATTIMAYRDSGADVISVARREIQIAGSLGKRATVGVETGDYDPEQITFYEEGPAAMREALIEVDDAFAGEPGYGGTAIHHYGALVDWELN